MKVERAEAERAVRRLVHLGGGLSGEINASDPSES